MGVDEGTRLWFKSRQEALYKKLARATVLHSFDMRVVRSKKKEIGFMIFFRKPYFAIARLFNLHSFPHTENIKAGRVAGDGEKRVEGKAPA